MRSLGVIQVPADDSETVGHGVGESGSFKVAVISTRDRDEACGSGVGRRHDDEEAVNLVDIADQIWSCHDVVSLETDPFGPAWCKVELPTPAGRREQRILVPDIADRLPPAGRRRRHPKPSD